MKTTSKIKLASKKENDFENKDILSDADNLRTKTPKMKMNPKIKTSSKWRWTEKWRWPQKVKWPLNWRQKIVINDMIYDLFFIW